MQAAETFFKRVLVLYAPQRKGLLQAQLEQRHPGLCKPIKLVTYRYNQDLSTGALLVEVGTAGNSHAEALRAAEFLAEGILSLANGANI